MNTYDCPTVCLCTSLLCLPRDEANHCFYFLAVLSMTDFLYLLVFISLKVCFSPSFHARHVLWGLWNPLLFSHAYRWCIHLLKTNLKSYLMIVCVCFDSMIFMGTEIRTNFYIIPVPSMVQPICKSDLPPGKELIILNTYCKLKQRAYQENQRPHWWK